jgi:hypothetical protein
MWLSDSTTPGPAQQLASATVSVLENVSADLYASDVPLRTAPRSHSVREPFHLWSKAVATPPFASYSKSALAEAEVVALPISGHVWISAAHLWAAVAAECSPIAFPNCFQRDLLFTNFSDLEPGVH